MTAPEDLLPARTVGELVKWLRMYKPELPVTVIYDAMCAESTIADVRSGEDGASIELVLR